MTRRKILGTILRHLRQAKQWGRDYRLRADSLQSAVESLHKALALIEMLEVHDHGSIGAFALGQKYTECPFERWVWLVKCDPEDEDLLKDTRDVREAFKKKAHHER